MAELTANRHLLRPRRHRSYPRVVRRIRHNRYRLKKAADTGRRHDGPAQPRFYRLTPPTEATEPAMTSTNLNLAA
jgi:hypothetical protein